MSPHDSIRLKHIGLTYDDHNGFLHVLEDIHARVHPREFLCILGPSGCGKTTLLRVLAGLDEITKGKVVYPGGRAPRVGIVFQETSLMPWRTVLGNITLPLELQGVDMREAQTRALDLVDLVELDGFQDVWPASLSGGMAQRVELARALIQDPDLLLLDEPFGSLDALTREQMGAELLRVWQARQKTVVMVTHSISEALLLADRVLVLTRLPARVCMDLTVDLPRPRLEEVRYTPRFQELARQLRSAIK